MSLLFSNIPKLTSEGNYNVDYPIKSYIDWIAEQEKDLNLNLVPDFQRGHVWTEQQQIEYIEYLIKGGKNANIIYFNSPSWMDWSSRYRDYDEFVCVDGLQRTTAICRFVNNEIPVFGHYLHEYEDKEILCRSLYIKININNLQTKKEVLQWYLDINSKGTPHTDNEIEKVKSMLLKA